MQKGWEAPERKALRGRVTWQVCLTSLEEDPPDRQATDTEKILVPLVCSEGHESRISKELSKLNKYVNSPIKSGQSA